MGFSIPAPPQISLSPTSQFLPKIEALTLPGPSPKCPITVPHHLETELSGKATQINYNKIELILKEYKLKYKRIK